MADSRITQQTSTALPLRGEFAHGAPPPRSLPTARFRGMLQWALEGPGWKLVRPLSDFVMTFLATVAALRGLPSLASSEAPLLALAPVVVLLSYLRGLYRSQLRVLVLDGFIPLLSTVSIAVMSVVTAEIVLSGNVPGQYYWARAWAYAFLGVAAGRVCLAALQRRARSRRLVGKPVLIVGAGLVGAQVARRLDNHPEYGFAPVGFLDEDPRSVPEVGGRDVPILGTIDDLDETVARTGARNLIVAFSSTGDDRVSRLIQHCQETGVHVSVVPRMFDTINNRVAYESVGGLPLLSFKTIDPKGLQFAIKHALDRVVAVVLLLLLSPLIAAVAAVVRISSPGPVLFRQRRVGRDGRLFDLYKFRSMRMPTKQGTIAEGSAIDYLLAGDRAPGGVEGEDRRTAIGRLMRRTSIDELPQLFNVLRGDMSLVGPRPERPEFVELFRQDIVRYGDRHRVKAGITGWAQVHGLRGQTSLAERVEWDNYYIAHWSLGLDLKILALTFAALFHDAE